MDDEEFDTTEQGDPEPDDIDDDQDVSSYFNPPFTEEMLRNRHQLRSTPFKEESIYELSKTTLSPRAKRAITTFITQYLSERTILANIESKELAEMDYDLSETLMKTTYYPTDTKNPALFHILKMLRSHYETILTNAYGPDRERVRNSMETLESRHINAKETIKIKKNKPKRKGILGL